MYYQKYDPDSKEKTPEELLQITTQQFHELQKEKSSKEKTSYQILGKNGLNNYLNKQIIARPEYNEEAKSFSYVLNTVKKFNELKPNAEIGTYDVRTLELIPTEEINGVCVTFHQNQSTDDLYGYYTDETYALLCAIAMHELNTNIITIGYYGSPEISFICKPDDNTDEALNDKTEMATAFAEKHNQESIYVSSTGKTVYLKKFNSDYNKIRKE